MQALRGAIWRVHDMPFLAKAQRSAKAPRRVKSAGLHPYTFAHLRILASLREIAGRVPRETIKREPAGNSTFAGHNPL